MSIFLMAMDHRIWGMMVNGYNKPIKAEEELEMPEKDAYGANYKALNAIIVQTIKHSIENSTK